MNQEIVRNLQQEMVTILRSNQKHQEKFDALARVRESLSEKLSKDSLEYSRLLTMICEMQGNVKAAMADSTEAEKQYRTMLETGSAMYKKDPKQFDLLYAQTNLRMGVFYKNLIKITVVNPTPRILNESQKKVYDASERFFRNAVRVSLEKIKSGHQGAVELQGRCMENLMVLKGAVGDYEEAEKIGEQLIKLGKALFQATDDGPHALELSQWMSTLATIYIMDKKYVEGMELLEDCAYVLEDKEGVSPEIFGIRLSSCYLNLGNAYFLIPEEEPQAEETYLKGIQKLETLNIQHQNKYEKDLKQGYMILYNYYQKKGQEEKAKEYQEKMK